MIKKSIVSCFVILVCVDCMAGVPRFARIFGDHMVLQREQPIHVWGFGDAGAEYSISLNESVKKVSVDEGGRWSVVFDAMGAGGPYDMRILQSDGDSLVCLKDILVGELWFFSGQSNMGMLLPRTVEGAMSVRMSNEHVRYASIQTSYSSQVEADCELDMPWVSVSPEVSPFMTAIAFYVGMELQQGLDVPVGVISCVNGGSYIREWMSLESLKSFKYGRGVLDRHYKDGSNEPSQAGSPSGSYNAKVAPIAGLSMAGVCWYQGESDVGRNRLIYSELLSHLITDWRLKWGRDIPFIIVQLPGRDAIPEAREKGWSSVRLEQWETARNLEHTHLVVTMDQGTTDDVHPPQKKYIAKRIYNTALSTVYKQEGAVTPIAVAVDFQGSEVQVFFDDTIAVFSERFAKETILKSFNVRSENENLVIDQCLIRGNSIVLTVSDLNKKIDFISYATGGAPLLTLYSHSGEPVSPFQFQNETGGVRLIYGFVLIAVLGLIVAQIRRRS